MNRILFVNGRVFDGTGTPAVPADVVVRGDRIESVRPGGGSVIEAAGSRAAEAGDQVIDCAGTTVMPGLVESHAHLTFPSAVGHIDPSFNPPLDVSFFRHMPTPEEHLAIARRNAAILLDHGFTSAYSAGSLTPVPTEVWLRDQIAAGATPGPRVRAASFERDNNPVQMGPDGPKPKKTGPDAVREFIREQAAIGFDAVKLLMSNDDVFVAGGLDDDPVQRRGSPGRRRAGPRVRGLAELPRAGAGVDQAGGPQRIPVGLPLHLRRRRGDRPAGGAPGVGLPLPRRRHHVGQRARGCRVRHRHRDGGEDGIGPGAQGDDRAVPRAAQARAAGAAGR